MESNIRTAKLAFARQKLKNHQEKKNLVKPNEECVSIIDTDSQDYSSPTIVRNDCSESVNGSLDHLCKNTEPTNFQLTKALAENENQVSELHSKLLHLENEYSTIVEKLSVYKQKNFDLEKELKNLTIKHSSVMSELLSKDKVISSLNENYSKIGERNNNLTEQIEFTKNLLTAKESENSALQRQLGDIQNRLELTELHLQQLSNGPSVEINENNNKHCEALLSKIQSLEQQLDDTKKEKEQSSAHYEQYVRELNEQLQSISIQNEQLRSEVLQITERENNLVEHMSEMEIIIQNLRSSITAQTVQGEQKDVVEYQQMYESMKMELTALKNEYDKLQEKFRESESKIQETNDNNIESDINYNKISIEKLNAEITSDKIAAQKATEQNKRLKENLHKLEDDFIKMSKDKLELTEKLSAEKYLNRELTIKLSEIEQNAKQLHNKVKAKDEEMIRLQVNLREAEKRLTEVEQKVPENSQSYNVPDDHDKSTTDLNIKPCTDLNSNEGEDNYSIPMGNAIIKLQNRFLRIMDEVANLSDEKQRLEHIILQLQYETDTICEYVALYQQQRSMLKRRDEERNIQIKLFQQECNQLKDHLEELSSILLRLANDEELSVYFKTESRRHDLDKVMQLLSNLQTNAIVDTSKQCSDFKNFYPCSCCSGQLIVV